MRTGRQTDRQSDKWEDGWTDEPMEVIAHPTSKLVGMGIEALFVWVPCICLHWMAEMFRHLLTQITIAQLIL